MRRVAVRPPSFPEVIPDSPLGIATGVRWQVLCGDRDHWRCGVWSPPETTAEACAELEQHTCPELFVLLSGRITLLLGGPEGVRELPLEPGKPVLVTGPHAGFCPDGPHGGVALVVERDTFETEYRPPEGWTGS